MTCHNIYYNIVTHVATIDFLVYLIDCVTSVLCVTVMPNITIIVTSDRSHTTLAAHIIRGESPQQGTYNVHTCRQKSNKKQRMVIWGSPARMLHNTIHP